MASTYSDLKIELIGTGEQSGTWGNTTNTNLGTAVEDAITGSATVTFSSADETLTLTNTNASQTARNLRLVLSGTSGGARQLILGSGCQINKLYLIQNDLADTVTVKNTAGTGTTVAAGQKKFVFNDGTNVADATTQQIINLTSQVTGTLPIANGGTGQTGTPTNGQLLIGNGSGFTRSTLTAGANVTITNTSGAITIAATGGGGTGDVVGPASATDNGFALFDGSTGKLLKNSLTQDGFVHGVRIGRGGSGVSTNTAVGNVALASNTSGDNNTAFGYQAANGNTTGYQNTAIGHIALISNTTGNLNTAVGHVALGTVNASGNTGIGNAAGAVLTTGTNNTAVGYQALGLATTGGNNSCLGYLAGRNGSPFNIGTESNRVVIGNSSVTDAYVQVAWTVTSDARDKVDVSPINHGLDLITKLNPVTFRWDIRNQYWVYDDKGNVISKPTPDGSKKNPTLFSGFLAQEVQQAIQQVGYPNDVIIDNEDLENLKIKETALIPVLVNAVKELKAELDVVKAELAALKG
jgi:hypothetical protein